MGMGDDADDILALYTTVQGKLDNFIIVKCNIIYKSSKCNMRVQRVEELNDNFITDFSVWLKIMALETLMMKSQEENCCRFIQQGLISKEHHGYNCS